MSGGSKGRTATALALAAAAVLCGSGRSAARHGLSLRVDRSPFRITLVRDGRALTQESPPPTRLRYQVRSTGDIYSLTRVTARHGDVYDVATNEPGRTATVRVSPAPQGFVVSVRLRPARDVQQVYDSFETTSSEHFLGGGERMSKVDLRGQLLPVYVSNSCSYAPVPFIVASGGWGLRLEGENVSALALPGAPAGSGCGLESRPSCEFPAVGERLDVCVRGATLVERLYAGTFPRLLAAYQAETGPPVVPPPSELAAMVWRGRTEFRSEADVLRDVHRYRTAGIPVGSVLLDDVWQTCMGSLRFDPARFPDPSRLIRAVHALGLGFLLWVSPKVSCEESRPWR